MRAILTALVLAALMRAVGDFHLLTLGWCLSLIIVSAIAIVARTASSIFDLLPFEMVVIFHESLAFIIIVMI